MNVEEAFAELLNVIRRVSSQEYLSVAMILTMRAALVRRTCGTPPAHERSGVYKLESAVGSIDETDTGGNKQQPLECELENDMNVNYNSSQFRVPPKLILEVLSLLRRVPRQLLWRRERAGRALLAQLASIAAARPARPLVLARWQGAQTQ